MNWTWQNLFGYMKKAESWSSPNAQQRAKGADGIDAYHGLTGPVQVGFTDDMFGGPQQGDFLRSVQNVTGIAKCQDVNGGKPNCVSFTPSVGCFIMIYYLQGTDSRITQSIDWHNHDHRSSSAAAYLTPVESARTNWLTLVNHQVLQLLWTTSSNNTSASGVQFKSSNNTGSTYSVHVRKEVILSAGAISTPALLQRSGVGDPALLAPLGIKTVLNITTVGKNLQEQSMSMFGAKGNGFNPGGRGPPSVIAFPNLYEVWGGNASAVAAHILASLDRWADEQKGHAFSKQALDIIYGVQADLIVNKKGSRFIY